MDVQLTQSHRVQVRPRRYFRGLAFATVAIAIVMVGFLLKEPRPTGDWVTSGSYRLLKVEPDGRLIVAALDSTNTGRTAIVSWLGIEIKDPSALAEFVRRRTSEDPRITLRLDRRRLNEQGQVEAYFFHGEQLLNSEVVELGFANESTHPSDFAAIARRIRNAAK